MLYWMRWIPPILLVIQIESIKFSTFLKSETLFDCWNFVKQEMLFLKLNLTSSLNWHVWCNNYVNVKVIWTNKFKQKKITVNFSEHISVSGTQYSETQAIRLINQSWLNFEVL